MGWCFNWLNWAGLCVICWVFFGFGLGKRMWLRLRVVKEGGRVTVFTTKGELSGVTFTGWGCWFGGVTRERG